MKNSFPKIKNIPVVLCINFDSDVYYVHNDLCCMLLYYNLPFGIFATEIKFHFKGNFLYLGLFFLCLSFFFFFQLTGGLLCLCITRC